MVRCKCTIQYISGKSAFCLTPPSHLHVRRFRSLLTSCYYLPTYLKPTTNRLPEIEIEKIWFQFKCLLHAPCKFSEKCLSLCIDFLYKFRRIQAMIDGQEKRKKKQLQAFIFRRKSTVIECFSSVAYFSVRNQVSHGICFKNCYNRWATFQSEELQACCLLSSWITAMLHVAPPCRSLTCIVKRLCSRPRP